MGLLYLYQNRVITTLYQEPLFSTELKPMQINDKMGGAHYRKLLLIITPAISYTLNNTVHNIPPSSITFINPESVTSCILNNRRIG
jgi:hypothetical protein